MSDWISAASSAVVAAAAAAGAFTAWRGLSTWRAELRGRTEYNLARRLLLDLYRGREAIRAARSPSMYPGEYESRPDRTTDDRPWSGKDLRYAYQQRLGRISATLVELDTDLLEAEALWGDELKTPRAQLQKCIAELWVNINKYLRANAQDEMPVFVKKPMTPEETEANDALVWDLGEGNDAFGDRVVAAIRQFETVLRPHLRR